MTALVIAEHDNASLKPATLHAVTAARPAIAQTQTMRALPQYSAK